MLQLWSGRELFELEYIGNGVYRDPVSGTTVNADITAGKELLNTPIDTFNHCSTP